MPIRLRFAVHGVRNNRIFHLVAIDQRKRRNARPLELLGVYRPRIEQTESDAPVKRMEWALDRVRFWLDHGAVPSESVTRMLQVAGVEKRTTEQLAQAKAEAKALEAEKARLAEERRRKRAEAAKAKAERDAQAAANRPPPRRARRDREPDRFSMRFDQATVDPILLRSQNIAKVQADEEFAARMRERAEKRRAHAAAVADDGQELAVEDLEGPEDELVDIAEHEYGNDDEDGYEDESEDVALRTNTSTRGDVSMDGTHDAVPPADHTPAPLVDERPANTKSSGNTGDSAPPSS
ncbi:ribosomal protein S16 [Auricularia subglabra TFB-10046 SS5]|nr:ribosomal protein S16 [Auricularia subglabra TFB-10046 SS5]